MYAGVVEISPSIASNLQAIIRSHAYWNFRQNRAKSLHPDTPKLVRRGLEYTGWAFGKIKPRFICFCKTCQLTWLV